MENSSNNIGINIHADASGVDGGIDHTEAKIVELNAVVDKHSIAANKLATQYSSLDTEAKKVQASALRNSEAYRNLDNQLAQLMGRIDPVYNKTRELDKANDLLHQGLKAGLITQAEHQSALGMLTQKYGGVVAATESTIEVTNRAKQEFMVLGREVVSGNFSRIPGTLSIIAQGLSGPVIAGLGLVTGAVGLGAVAWESYGLNIEKVQEDLDKLTANMGIKTIAELNKQFDELEKLAQKKRAEASAGGWGWQKDAEEAALYEAQLRKIGIQIDENAKLEVKLGDPGGIASKLASQSKTAKNRDIQHDIDLLQIYHDKQQAGSNAEIDSLSKITELKEKLVGKTTGNNAAQRIADELVREQDKYERMAAIAEAADLKGEARIQAKAILDLQHMTDEREREVKHFGNLGNADNLYAQAKVARWKQAEEEIAAMHTLSYDKATTDAAQFIDKMNQFAMHANTDLEFRAILEGKSAVETARLTAERKAQLEVDREIWSLMQKFKDDLPARDAAVQQVARASTGIVQLAGQAGADGAMQKGVEQIGSLDQGKTENDRYANQLAAYQAYAAQHNADAQANSIILQGIEKQHQDKMLALARAGQLSALQYERLTAEQKKQLLVGSSGQLLGALGAHNKAAFEANKLYSKGKLVVDVASAIGEHMKLPFPMNAIQVATDVALGATQLSAINSAQFGGGGSISAGGGSAGGGSMPSLPTPSYSAPAVPASPTVSAPVTVAEYHLTLVGAKDNPDKPLLSYNSAVEMITYLNEAADKGHRVNANLVAA